MTRGASPKTYPPDLVDRVRHLYAEGHTQIEIGNVVGLSQKVIWNLMRRHGITPRPAVKRDQSRERNHMWKGDDALYQAMHLRVAAARGCPSQCSACGSTNARRYEWANLTGSYHDVHDYVRMCIPCHRRFDAGRRCQGGDAKCR